MTDLQGGNPGESVYSMEDHHREPLRFPACNCGAVWKQRGNRTGHCTKCHRTFEGVSTFDRHQRVGHLGETICLHPTEVKIKGQSLELVEGSWRGPGMSENQLERLLESLDETETPDRGEIG